jgi:hypothetical protein
MRQQFCVLTGTRDAAFGVVQDGTVKFLYCRLLRYPRHHFSGAAAVVEVNRAGLSHKPERTPDIAERINDWIAFRRICRPVRSH